PTRSTSLSTSSISPSTTVPAIRHPPPFSFQSSRPHRHLHSFPTRRSSDLPRALERGVRAAVTPSRRRTLRREPEPAVQALPVPGDRKSTRLNSSHDQISYAVFCLKKKKLMT